MNHLELILPFSIPPAGLEKDLARQLQTPALARLIAAAGKPKLHSIPDFSRALAHEYWLSGQFPPESRANSPSTSWNAMQALAMTPSAGVWFTLQPVHIHIARDHLVLTDQRRLELAEHEARSLFAVAQTVCEESGLELVYGDALSWFLRADDWADMQTASADAACGHNIDIWMAQGQHERAWRKLQNEIQMLWFAHEINAARELRGAKPVNSVWLAHGSAGLHHAAKPYARATGWSEWQAGDDSSAAVLLDSLSEAALNSDWGLWLEQMQQLERDWFAPALHALRDRRLSALSLVCSDAQRLAQFDITPWSLRKFWIKPSLHHLFSLP
ncbi:MAG: hypothetical protein HYZ65_06795 [Burkholderiales bacterium]|nr:hypothetical protein [Burkholderiales bacterium]